MFATFSSVSCVVRTACFARPSSIRSGMVMSEHAGLGVLYLCATPIGNLSDMTFRAVRILGESDLVAAEDTRQTRKLFNHYDIKTPLTSYHEHNMKVKGELLVRELLAGKQVALVSDAGLPGISDPGELLVTRAIEMGIQVVPVPGANAALCALVASGLPTGAFVFEGFLPSAPARRRRKITGLSAESRTILLFESPHRLVATLKDLLSILGDRKVVVARELTKVFEEFWRGHLSAAVEHFESSRPRGEITLCLAGVEPGVVAVSTGAWDSLSLSEHVDAVEAVGDTTRKDAVREVARLRGLPRREVYNAVMRREPK